MIEWNKDILREPKPKTSRMSSSRMKLRKDENENEREVIVNDSKEQRTCGASPSPSSYYSRVHLDFKGYTGSVRSLPRSTTRLNPKAEEGRRGSWTEKENDEEEEAIQNGIPNHPPFFFARPDFQATQKLDEFLDRYESEHGLEPVDLDREVFDVLPKIEALVSLISKSRAEIIRAQSVSWKDFGVPPENPKSRQESPGESPIRSPPPFESLPESPHESPPGSPRESLSRTLVETPPTSESPSENLHESSSDGFHEKSPENSETPHQIPSSEGTAEGFHENHSECPAENTVETPAESPTPQSPPQSLPESLFESLLESPTESPPQSAESFLLLPPPPPSLFSESPKSSPAAPFPKNLVNPTDSNHNLLESNEEETLHLASMKATYTTKLYYTAPDEITACLDLIEGLSFHTTWVMKKVSEFPVDETKEPLGTREEKSMIKEIQDTGEFFGAPYVKQEIMGKFPQCIQKPQPQMITF